MSPESALGETERAAPAPQAVLPLTISPRELDAVRRMAAASWPEQAGGLLVGRAGPDGVHVERVTLARRGERDRLGTSGVVPSEHWLAEDALVRPRGLRIVGLWVARPDRASEPYARASDRLREGAVHLVVATTRDGARAPEALRHVRGGFVMQELRVADDPARSC